MSLFQKKKRGPLMPLALMATQDISTGKVLWQSVGSTSVAATAANLGRPGRPVTAVSWDVFPPEVLGACNDHGGYGCIIGVSRDDQWDKWDFSEIPQPPVPPLTTLA